MWESLEKFAPVVIHKLNNNLLLLLATVDFQRHYEWQIGALEGIIADHFANFPEWQLSGSSITVVYCRSRLIAEVLAMFSVSEPKPRVCRQESYAKSTVQGEHDGGFD